MIFDSECTCILHRPKVQIFPYADFNVELVQCMIYNSVSSLCIAIVVTTINTIIYHIYICDVSEIKGILFNAVYREQSALLQKLRWPSSKTI